MTAPEAADHLKAAAQHGLVAEVGVDVEQFTIDSPEPRGAVIETTPVYYVAVVGGSLKPEAAAWLVNVGARITQGTIRID